MTKLSKILFILISLVAVGSVFAGADALTAFGVPQSVAGILCPSGVSVAILPLLLPITEQQTGLVVAYKNKALIADQAMPVKQLDGPELSFKWWKRRLGDAFTAQDTKVGRMSAPNKVYFEGDWESAVAKAFGLETSVMNEDLDQIKDKTRYLNSALEGLIDRVLLGREVRVAGIVQDAANYESSQVKTCTAEERIGTNTDVYGMIMQMFEDALVRPNVFGMNSLVYTKLRSDKSIIAAIYPNGNGKGVATKEQLMELFEVDDLIVGKARVNTNRNPKSPSLENCWGNNLWAHYQEPLSSLTDGLAWGMTAQVGDRVAETVEDKDMGLKGGVTIKSGFYQAEVVTAKAAGVLIKGIAA
ncbi:MAG: hypothetical protein WCS18_10720 [Sphaerochaetaceae bacterium]|jgi:hypothetical protein